MITLLSVTLRNFLSIGSIVQVIDLNGHGLTLVIGENIDVGGGNSRNGVGKTSLLQAISYALYGEPLTKIKLDNLCNNINNKGMLVTIEFEVNGQKHRIERGRKPNVLRYFVDGIEENEAKGKNATTQEDIDKVLGMSHTMFKHVVALNTYTEPFMKLKAAEQREVIEELLGITQLSQRASALKELMDITKEQLRDEEARIKANAETNARIEQAIERAREDAEVWQSGHDRRLATMVSTAEKMGEIDIDAETTIFDQIDTWLQQKREIDGLTKRYQEDVERCTIEIVRLQKEITRYQSEAERVDNGEIARLEAQVKRYLAESEEDIAPQLNRLTSEAARRRKEADAKMANAEKFAVDMVALQEQIDNPNAHTCSTCGQGLAGTGHLAKVVARLEKQVQEITSQIEKAMADADTCNNDADAIDRELVQTEERQAAKKDEALSKVKTIRQDIAVARDVLIQQKETAAERVTELREMVVTVTEQQAASRSVVVEARDTLVAIGAQPTSQYSSRDSLWKLKQERDLLLNQIESEMAKPNIHLSKIEGLQSTLSVINYDSVNELNLRLKHEVFLHKLLTAKDSFIRKKIVDQNLMYLNHRLNHYLEKLGLPHEVRFMADLTVEISLLGRELDFEQLSRGEMNRVILATWWSFRDVWESLNASFNLLFVDECLDFGMDDQGAEAALQTLQSMARDRHKNVFLISHKENLIGRADRVMLVRKEDQFTSFVEDYQMVA